MMCQRIGLLPISIIGLGRTCVSSLIRVPAPPARITAFIALWTARRGRFRLLVDDAPGELGKLPVGVIDADLVVAECRVSLPLNRHLVSGRWNAGQWTSVHA